MREHLFRGERAENSGTSSEQAGEWIEGYLTEYLPGDKGRIGISRKGLIVEVIPDTVQVYTGKKIPETNEKIYEGDILFMQSMSSEKYFLVTWSSQKCAFELRGFHRSAMRFDMEMIGVFQDVKIVGNILGTIEDLT